jgi:SAM-dependent methyltransferase
MSEYSYVGEELAQARHALNWKRYFGARLAPYLRGRVLEVGAGLGGTTIPLRRPPATSWTCLEPDATLAAQLRTALGETPSTVPADVVVGGLEALEPSAKFSAILYIDVLEHIEDDRGELSRAVRHLEPNGHLIVLSPAFPQLFSELDRALGHYRRYTKATLAAVFPAGMEPMEIFYLDSLGMVASLANKFLMRQGAPTERQIRFWDRAIIPVSRVADKLLGRFLGRSVIAVYRKAPGVG